ncbi:MAG: hypothetical protein VKL60_19490 [Sphaerospermopsis sp.]|nr:hypothetical protein [Sphaerospermopsis sp.]
MKVDLQVNFNDRYIAIIIWVLITACYPINVFSADNIEEKLNNDKFLIENNYLYILEESKITDKKSSNQHMESKLTTLASSQLLNYFCNKYPKEDFIVKANIYGITKHKVIIADNSMKVIVKVPIQSPDCIYQKKIIHEQKNIINSDKDTLNMMYENDGNTIQLDNKTEY